MLIHADKYFTKSCEIKHRQHVFMPLMDQRHIVQNNRPGGANIGERQVI